MVLSPAMNTVHLSQQKPKCLLSISTKTPMKQMPKSIFLYAEDQMSDSDFNNSFVKDDSTEWDFFDNHKEAVINDEEFKSIPNEKIKQERNNLSAQDYRKRLVGSAIDIAGISSPASAESIKKPLPILSPRATRKSNVYTSPTTPRKSNSNPSPTTPRKSNMHKQDSKKVIESQLRAQRKHEMSKKPYGVKGVRRSVSARQVTLGGVYANSRDTETGREIRRTLSAKPLTLAGKDSIECGSSESSKNDTWSSDVKSATSTSEHTPAWKLREELRKSRAIGDPLQKTASSVMGGDDIPLPPAFQLIAVEK